MSVAHRLNRAWILVSIVVLSSCASTQESDLKKSESSRNVGEVYYQQGNFTQALKHFLEAEKLNPDDPELQNNLGLAYMSKDRIDLAIVHFKKALVIKPDFSKVKNNIGVAYLRKKNWDAAIFHFKELSEDLLYERPYYPLFNLGQAYYFKHDLKQAEHFFLMSLKQNGQFLDALQGLGRTYMAMGKGGAAVSTLNKAVKLSPEVQLLYFDLARAYLIDGHPREALEAFQKVIDLDPDSQLATEAKTSRNRIKINTHDK